MSIEPGETSVRISPLGLAGDLTLPERASGLVIFAHGSGSSRLSPRNRRVAASIAEAGIATLLFDLLTEAEALSRANVFDIELLAGRLIQAIDWAGRQPGLAGLPIGLFGASTGAAAAVIAAAARPEEVATVISRGGRPDLAEAVLGKVRVPTLLIVGGRDEPVLSWNRACLTKLGGEAVLEVVPGATHVFEESGALEQVTHIAVRWFGDHLHTAEGAG